LSLLRDPNLLYRIVADLGGCGVVGESTGKLVGYLAAASRKLKRPLHVFNPFAPQLTFPTHKTRMRRDHAKYLTLIDTIAFLHQHQRTVYTLPASSLTTQVSNLTQYVNVHRNDIAIATASDTLCPLYPLQT
jgi:hypothetical protein